MKIWENRLMAGALSRTLLGELTALILACSISITGTNIYKLWLGLSGFDVLLWPPLTLPSPAFAMSEFRSPVSI